MHGNPPAGNNLEIVNRPDSALLEAELRRSGPSGNRTAGLGSSRSETRQSYRPRLTLTYSAPAPPWPMPAVSKPTTSGRKSGLSSHMGT
jgi:hypothetical protein